jgi:acyl carrier protein
VTGGDGVVTHVPRDENQVSHTKKRRQGIVAMTKQEIFVAFAATVQELAETPASDVTPEADLIEDLNIDSLTMVEIIVSAQSKFGVEIPDKDLKDLRTVQDVVDYVEQRSGVKA